MSVAAIDPRRLDLAAEFRVRPFGRHSRELQALLDIMRRAENCQDLIVVSIGPGEWALGERQPDGKPPRLLEDQIFESARPANGRRSAGAGERSLVASWSCREDARDRRVSR